MGLLGMILQQELTMLEGEVVDREIVSNEVDQLLFTGLPRMHIVVPSGEKAEFTVHSRHVFNLSIEWNNAK